jgi:hypothetical protein
MDDTNRQPAAGIARPDPSTPDGRDVLISRVIDAEASPEDWSAFRVLAERDPSVWGDLAEAQRHNELLGEAFRREACVADSVELPELIADDRRFQRRLDSVGRWGGWAAAAAIVLVWSTGVPLGTANRSGTQTGSIIPLGVPLSEATPDEAMARYIDAGQRAGMVVGEVPDRLVIETIPQDDGSIEVVYLRQIIERRITNQVYRESRTDAGTTVPVRIPPADIQRSRSF